MRGDADGQATMRKRAKTGMGMRLWALALAGMALLLLAGCASGGKQMNALEQAQYDYTGAIRWGNFEGAWTMVDPEYKKKHPMTDLEFARYTQIEISGYRDIASTVSPDNLHAMREVVIGVVNKHTMAERETRYTEVWRYDPEAKTWWVTSGLPNLWQGD